ncbi:MAG: signal peptidase I [Verrucomicrobia bacterium]|nr:signal peptidase I [Verrucomicrobiota bacterium]
MFFTPMWKKEAKLLAKGARKFLHYKRDLLKPDRIDEINSRREDLLDAIRAGNQDLVKEASKQLQATCENALPREAPLTWFEENVEVMFVAIVIALGLRAYYLQPFRIPTGSMMPTLNGITGYQKPEAEWPSAPSRVLEQIHRGRSYVKVINDRDRTLSPKGWVLGSSLDPREVCRDFQWMHFFSKSYLISLDAPPLRLPAPGGPMLDAGLKRALIEAYSQNDGVLKKGVVLAEGYIDTGDLVLVDKVSYHFRNPKRGEVFVFDTIENRGIHQSSGDQAAGSHYIKRLCGLPGDSLSVATPEVLNHGKILLEPGIQRVAHPAGKYAELNPSGYLLANPQGSRIPPRLMKPTDTLDLAARARPGMREYAALGDNTGNSLDSRYWGPVKEFNLVGPALFSLWPFSTSHWGFID